MRALAFQEFGTTPTVHQLPTPQPGTGEVLVRIHAASVNGFDLSVASGRVKDWMEHRFPVVLGKDYAGTVEVVGEGVSDYAVGSRVFGVVTKPYLGDGSFAQYVTVPVAIGLAHLPDAVSFTDGAALGLAGTAALSAVDAAGLQPGQTVLVIGATGGVGNQAVQLAVNAGAKVIATAHSDAERQLVQSLGAGHVVDYGQDLAAQVREIAPNGVDVVLNFAGDPASQLPLVREGGRLVSTLLLSPEQLPSETVAVTPILAQPTPEMLNRLAENQATGRTRVHVQQVYALDDAPTALTDFAGGTLGKLVITTD